MKLLWFELLGLLRLSILLLLLMLLVLIHQIYCRRGYPS
jgi:hypothetical protein